MSKKQPRLLIPVSGLKVGTEYAYASSAALDEYGQAQGPIRRIRITEIVARNEVRAEVLDETTGAERQTLYRVSRARVFAKWSDRGPAPITVAQREENTRLRLRRDEIASLVDTEDSVDVAAIMDRIGDLDQITLSRAELIALLNAAQREAWSHVAY